jgi:hypothetical protein
VTSGCHSSCGESLPRHHVHNPHTREGHLVASSATCSLRLTRCVLSLGTLTDPAKGARCAHLPQCNYETLRDHTSRVRTCPVAGCVALLQRSHDIERDDALAAQLRQLPLGTARVWVRGAEVRADTAAVKQTRSSQGHGKSNLVVLD